MGMLRHSCSLVLALLLAACGSPGSGSTVGNGGTSSGSGGTSSGSGGTSHGGGGTTGVSGSATATGGSANASSAGASGSNGSSGSAGANTVVGNCGNGAHQLFPPTAPWNTAVDSASLDAQSSAVVGYLQANHTAAVRFQIDLSIHVLKADASTMHRTFTPTGDFFEGECDTAPPPVPAGGALEGETGYACTSDGDCHLLVVDSSACRLYEMWRANIVGSSFEGGCQAIWDIGHVPPATGRGEQCGSADAAGLPIAPLVFTADEIAAGEIPHALRFALPNDFIQNRTYVHPGTHATGSAAGGTDAPAYGARLRLKSSYNASGLSAPAQVIATALKRYGMYLADGGNITFMGTSDQFTTKKWSEVGLDTHDFLGHMQWSDFELVDGGARIHWDGNCVHTVITQ
jgi:hypothetical protein